MDSNRVELTFVVNIDNASLMRMRFQQNDGEFGTIEAMRMISVSNGSLINVSDNNGSIE
jgi:hypothetical protein